MSAARSRTAAEDPERRVDVRERLKAVGDARSEVLRVAEHESAAPAHDRREPLESARLEAVVEVDEDVTAEDEIKRGNDCCSGSEARLHEVVLGKVDACA